MPADLPARSFCRWWSYLPQRSGPAALPEHQSPRQSPGQRFARSSAYLRSLCYVFGQRGKPRSLARTQATAISARPARSSQQPSSNPVHASGQSGTSAPPSQRSLQTPRSAAAACRGARSLSQVVGRAARATPSYPARPPQRRRRVALSACSHRLGRPLPHGGA